MKDLVFQVIFLSDVVLNAKTATEGNRPTLDYIPGSNFLGLMAKNYRHFSPQEAYSLFHSGEVSFGDAHIMQETRSHKIPFAWYERKIKMNNGNNEIIVHHKMSDTKKKQLMEEGVQLVQIREGFIIKNKNNFDQINLFHKYFQKSAQDRLKRRSADEKMFGYEALEAGTSWSFNVRLQETAYKFKDDIIQTLDGEHFIGRSRTSQFGRISIKFLHEENLTGEVISESPLILYADSHLCFYNQFGFPTLTPTAKEIGLPEQCTIDWSKSQVRQVVYAPWNFKRATRDADRICISKGSVLVIELNGSNVKTDVFFNGLGAFTNEGLGTVLINPDFFNTNSDGVLESNLNKLNLEIKLISNKISTVDLTKNEEDLLQLLKHISDKKIEEEQIIKEVKLFYEDYMKKSKNFKGLSPSQWGGVREIAGRSINYNKMMTLLFGNENTWEENEEDKNAYLKHGILKEHWDKNGRRKILLNKLKNINDKNLDAVKYTIVLASFMAKRASK